MADPLDVFSAPTRAWFSATFAAPTAPQAEGWPRIAAGDHTLVCAPTGTGKTLAAFLWAIDRIMSVQQQGSHRQGPHRQGAHRQGKGAQTRLLYVSPLRALAVDVDKNLRAPLRGIRLAADRLDIAVREPTVGVRTGDTSAEERRHLVRRPPEILITTPESLFLMLTSRARETLSGVEHVIVDEIHALANSKRGSHLMVSLERLEELCASSPQRIALSATQRPLEEVARFLGGFAPGINGAEPVARPVSIVDAAAPKELDVKVVVPVEDMASLGETVEAPASAGAAVPLMRRSIWPAIHPRLLELIQSHHSTLIFCNARRLSERLASRLNELHSEAQAQHDRANEPTRAQAPPVLLGDENVGSGSMTGDELVKAHHGSLSRQRRLLIEDELKRGELRGLVATSTLELGIDMGAVDLVVQVASPGSVASGLQRIGRAGHQVGEPSRGRIFPKHRADLLEAAAVVERMHQRQVEQTRYLRNPLDVAAQQIVAMCAMDDWGVQKLAAVLRRCACFVDLSDEVLNSVLDLLSGTYPAEEFAELRPRIIWDRAAGELRGRAGAQRLAVTNAGTIPDRGLFGVFLPDGTRVGELDEEMVYESRVGETFLLGASTWRIVDITFERVVVTPAPGELGKMPFWHGDGPGRPIELGRAVGQMVRELRADPDPNRRLQQRCGLDETAATNLVAYLQDQAEATGAVPDDRTVVVERFRDEIGDWRVCLLTPFGAQVHAPWGIALRARLGEVWGVDTDVMWGDDGIVMRLPEAVDELAVDDLLFDPAEVGDLVAGKLGDTSMFASRFRECAARALLLPRRRPDQRTPLWQQRRRASDLLAVASKYPSFPILLETTRECLQDVFDLPALVELMTDLHSRRVRVVAVDTPQASPFAQSLLFSWIAVFMYEGDAPLAERRAAALALDRDLLRDLLGAEELRELLDAGVIADIELELQRLATGYQARDVDEAHDLLRVLGPLTLDDLAARCTPADVVREWVTDLVQQRRAVEVRLGGRPVVAAAADAARLRDAAGAALPVGLAADDIAPVDDPLGDLCVRYARTHGPFVARDVASWLGISDQHATARLTSLVKQGRLLRGEFRPAGVEPEYCDAEVLRRIRRRCLAALRHEVEPVAPEALARFLPAWQGVGMRRRGVDALAGVVGQLQGAPVAASVLEADVLASRVYGYKSSDLDQLCMAGELVWVGAGALGSSDGRVRLAFRDQAAVLIPHCEQPVDGAVHDALRHGLEHRGASFWTDLLAAVQAASLPYDTESVLAALWDLVWNGEVTNDSLAPLRARVGRGSGSGSAGRGRRPPSRGGRRQRSGRLRLGGLSASGPPEAAGRWSLVEPLLQPEPADTQTALARAHQLLDRYGVVTRETALAEGQQGGFAGVYPVLKALEERGEVRRGYFVAGLGAAQFALPGAVDRLRAARTTEPESESESAAPLVLAATDPAQPYGAALAWPGSPGRPARAVGAHVVLADAVPLVLLERGSRSIITFEGAESSDIWIGALVGLLKDGRLRKLEITKVNGQPIRETQWVARLEAAGFIPSYKGMLYRC